MSKHSNNMSKYLGDTSSRVLESDAAAFDAHLAGDKAAEAAAEAASRHYVQLLGKAYVWHSRGLALRTEQDAKARAAAEAERAKVVAARWAGANVASPKGLCEFFHTFAPDSPGSIVFTLAGRVAAHSLDEARMQERNGYNLEPALAVGAGHVLVGFAEDVAEGASKRLGLGKTLSWSAGGWRWYAFRNPPGFAPLSVRGERVTVLSNDGPMAGTASLHDARWHVGPGGALPKGGDGLPVTPQALEVALRAAGGTAGGEADRLFGIL